ncbi:hypothetical protein ACJJTC_008322 [Scirpophaga incertulas]
MYFLLTLVAAASSLLYWVYWRWTNRRLLELASSIPGPPAYPFIGNATIFLFNTKDQLNKIAKMFDEYGEYCRFWLGPELNITVKNPADIRLLLTSNKVNHKGPQYKFMIPFIGGGILSGGPTWRNHRKIATPSYNKKSVQIFADIFNAEAEVLANTLSKKNPGDTFNIFYDVLNSTTAAVCQTLMGLSKEEYKDLKNLREVMLQTQRMYDLIFKQMTQWWLQIPFIYWLTGTRKRQLYYQKLVDEFSSDIVARRHKALETTRVHEDAMGIVDRYILSGELTEEEIKQETFTLFTTSQEAAAKITSGVLLFLGLLPDWQKQVYDEVMQVVGYGPVTEQHLKELHYLDMVYKETLRYFSIAGLIQRTVEEEVTINDGKITLPAGTSLVIPIHELHRDPKHWEDPLRVMPERFLPENVKKRDPNAFVPFSLGAMDCLGRVFATALIKTLVVHTIRKVHITSEGPTSNLELEIAISVKAAKGYNVRVKPRETNGYHKANGIKQH